MKKAVKVLLGIAAAGASASAAAFAVKKYRDGHNKYAGGCDDFFTDEDPDTEPDEDDDYDFTPEEEESLIGTDDSVTADSDDTASNLVVLDKDGIAFIKYLVDGIKNVAYLMDARNEDIERLIRRRNISNADKLAQIRALCAAGKDNVDLLNGCAEDISDVVSEKIPEDFWEFIMNDYKEDTEDGE